MTERRRPAPGIAWGQVIFAAGLLLAVALFAWSQGWLGVTPAATEAPRTSVTVRGQGTMNSAPFFLGAGDWRVEWSASVPSRSCYHGVSLRTAADERAADLVSLSVEGSGRGEAWAYNLEAGRYFVTANSGCESWQFVFHPA